MKHYNLIFFYLRFGAVLLGKLNYSRYPAITVGSSHLLLCHWVIPTMTKLYSSETMLLLVAFLLIFIGFSSLVDQKTLSKLLGIYQKLNLIFIRLYPEGKKKKKMGYYYFKLKAFFTSGHFLKKELISWQMFFFFLFIKRNCYLTLSVMIYEKCFWNSKNRVALVHTNF